jgi:exodeoxyribonuclease VII small subunit
MIFSMDLIAKELIVSRNVKIIKENKPYMKKENNLKELETIPFEKALERLEAVVSKMESGKLPLDEMMKYFEEGAQLSSVCEKKLKELEKKIEILVREDNQGGKWKDFSSDEKKENQKENEYDADDIEEVKDSLL